MRARAVMLFVLITLLVFAAVRVGGQGVTPTPKPLYEGVPVEPVYRDRAIKGDAVSTAISPKGDLLFVSVLDKEEGLRIYRIPIERVP